MNKRISFLTYKTHHPDEDEAGLPLCKEEVSLCPRVTKAGNADGGQFTPFKLSKKNPS